MTRTTLTSKLYLRIIPVILIAIGLIGLLAFKSVRHEIDNVYDAQLINDANVLWGLLQRPLLREPDDPPRRIEDIDFKMDNQLALNQDADDYADAHMVRAWKNGKIQIFSSTAFQADLPQQKAGFHTISYNGERWRVYSLPIPNTTIAVEVGDKIELRDKLIANILENLIFPLFILLPIVAFLIWLGITSGLSPIRDFVRHIRLRSPDDLSAIPFGRLPLDLMPLGSSINQLLEKLGHSLTLERRFSDLVAHELRTPQAGVKLLLQMLRDSETGTERDAIVADLVASNDRAMHLIEQLLRLARVSHHPLHVGPVPLYHVVASIAAGFGSRVTAKGLDLSLRGSEQAEIMTDDSLLRLMISNLIDNALKYTPAGGRVEVSIEPDGEAWLLTIDDTGPGIPDDQRLAVFQRFYRVDSPQEEGSGLGLAIVADVATRLGASVGLSTPDWGQGLRTTVRFAAG